MKSTPKKGTPMKMGGGGRMGGKTKTPAELEEEEVSDTSPSAFNRHTLCAISKNTKKIIFPRPIIHCSRRCET